MSKVLVGMFGDPRRVGLGPVILTLEPKESDGVTQHRGGNGGDETTCRAAIGVNQSRGEGVELVRSNEPDDMLFSGVRSEESAVGNHRVSDQNARCPWMRLTQLRAVFTEEAVGVENLGVVRTQYTHTRFGSDIRCVVIGAL
eukprot:CAMPEP_0175900390 /NCGR_PEP_ID=MMETSP0108-20121206/2310_1 /TAXON_ID=195067 ORGANISM="Goniomonas pacifica, Strain CCMP1869" /NCGR_SAMPLE_ID=MMETSP0108 /ASSEMBLY_ACC=CAM_ASM_000204 /LENGTH=141 /DNA_ID=CAMNT_0017221917 /DNA_START=230 /DNA_END=655 /DNA_ORIENTATION=+